jgi:flagellar motor switch protein FliM
MAEALVENVIRRKILAARAEVVDGGPGADRGWRLALARAARDELKLALDFTSLAMERRSLAELLDLPPDRGLIVVLDGPAEGLGLLLISAPVLAAMIEVQTIGRVGSGPVAPRKPTRTDAAMMAGMIDAALAGLEQALAQEADLVWAGGFRYASFLEDPRPLGLLLEDTSYRVLNAEVSLGMGARTGAVILALPAEGRGVMPPHRIPEAISSGPGFAESLALRVEAAESVLTAIVARLSLPLSRLMDLRVGEVMELPRAGIDRISFEGLDGRAVAEGRLGQNRGMRAIRLTPNGGSPRPAAETLPAAVPVAMPEPLRQSA